MAEQTNPPSITTLGEFLTQSGAQYRVFDMGRRVVKIGQPEFAAFEQATQAYPYPLQKTAHFGIVFWNPDLKDKHYIWFLKFPLDEQGLLIQAARDEFLVMLLDRVGECMLAANEGEQIEGALKDSPYTFKPRDDKMAAFNAKATASLANKPSQYHQHALNYFTGQIGAPDWQMLAMQGVADVAVRLTDKQDIAVVASRLAELPEPPFTVLCNCLEHTATDNRLVEAIVDKVEGLLQAPELNISLLSACLRAVSHSPATGQVDNLVKTVLNHPQAGKDIEILATISGRIWRILEQTELCQLFVERLAENNADYAGFSHVLADAMYLPGLRTPIMNALRSANRSEALTQRVGEMFGQASA